MVISLLTTLSFANATTMDGSNASRSTLLFKSKDVQPKRNLIARAHKVESFDDSTLKIRQLTPRASPVEEGASVAQEGDGDAQSLGAAVEAGEGPGAAPEGQGAQGSGAGGGEENKELEQDKEKDLALMAAKEGIDGWLTDVNTGNIKELAKKYYKNDAKLISNGDEAANTEEGIQKFWDKVMLDYGAKEFSWEHEKWEYLGRGVYKRSCDWTSNILHGKVISEIWEYDAEEGKAFLTLDEITSGQVEKEVSTETVAQGEGEEPVQTAK